MGSILPEYSAQWTIQDMKGAWHTLEMGDSAILLDHQSCTIELDASARLHFVRAAAPTISCSAKAFWFALAGEQAMPTAEEAGRLLAQNLLYCEQLRQWRALFQQMQVQAKTLLQMPVPEPTFPSPRLDAFTEEVLARTRSRVTPVELETLALLLKKDVEVIRGWLATRGKQVIEQEPVVIQVQAATQEPVSVPSDASEAQTAFPKPKPHGRGNIFWTPERLQMLQAALKQHESVMPVKKRFQLVAEQCGFNAKAVQAKFYELRTKEQEERLRRFVEDRKRADEQAATEQVVEPNTLVPGPNLWDVEVDGHLQRWPLGYAYGSFPSVLSRPGTQIIYRQHCYTVQFVWSSKLHVASTSDAQSCAEEDLVEVEQEAIPA